MHGSFYYALCLLCFTSFVVTGCSTPAQQAQDTFFQYNHRTTASNEPIATGNENTSASVALSVQKMLDASNRITANTTVAVADFVTLAANYDRTTTLGKYLGQAYLTALHNAGIATIDYQITGDIRVTPEGNLGLTQDYLELSDKVNANAILVGTITPSLSGFTIHSRIVDNTTKQVMGADQFFLTNEKVSNSVDVFQ